ncbi:MAG: succinate dehydrogenase cytochrome b subunit [Armatimonadota bacterium]
MSQKPSSSSIATKALIAVTGVGLIAYLVLHIAGNLVVFAGPDKFNRYSDFLIKSPVTLPLEIALALVFLIHVYKTVTNFAKNRAARPQAYAQKKWAGHTSRKSVASTTMIVTGSIILLFLVMHLVDFRFGSHYEVAGTDHVRDLYRTEMEVLSNPWKVLLYSVAMLLIGSHLWHGGWSWLQSLGLGSERYTPAFVRGAKALAVIIAGGFLVIVLWVFFFASRGYVPGGAQ